MKPGVLFVKERQAKSRAASELQRRRREEKLERELKEAIELALTEREFAPSSRTLEAWFPKLSETEEQQDG